jgi:hypothetical protein
MENSNQSEMENSNQSAMENSNEPEMENVKVLPMGNLQLSVTYPQMPSIKETHFCSESYIHPRKERD